MSIFSSIVSKIFSGHPATAADPGAQTEPAATSTASAPNTESPEQAGSAFPSTPRPPVDVEAVLTDLASRKPQPLNWRTSIVDLLKLLDLDSSLNARRELAHELHFPGDINDSAAMNLWLHKQVMRKLAENGGKVPDDLKS